MKLFKLMSAICLVTLVAAITGCGHYAVAHGSGNIPKGQTIPGVDVLKEQNYEILQGKRVGLITNHTGLTRNNQSIIDAIYEAPGVNLVALYSPEHGIRGTLDRPVDDGIDDQTGLPIYSLYGQTRKPTPEMMEGIDIMVFDIQDIGTRFYTYIGTMALAMQAAAEHDVEFVVLDRPNPIGGHKVEGIVADPEVTGGITAIYPIPTRHGMTVGELALLFNTEFEIGVDLTVIPVKNWKRNMYWDETGLLWVNPSPNMKTLNGAILYPGLGTGETTTLSCGRGLDRPFEKYGAPFMDGEKIAAGLNARNIPGLHFVPFSHTPTAPYHQFRGELCHGIFAIIYDREAFDSVEAGFHMFQVMYETHPDQYQAHGGFRTSSGSPKTWELLIEQGKSPREVLDYFQPELDKFMETRAKYLLYP